MLKTVDWMDNHNFAADQRVRRFPLTLEREPDNGINPYIHFKVIGKDCRRGIELGFPT